MDKEEGWVERDGERERERERDGGNSHISAKCARQNGERLPQARIEGRIIHEKY
jgi:hypothetical protein